MSSTLRSALREAALVCVAGTALSVGLFGRLVVGHLGSRALGVGPDPTVFVWAFGWWPHALGSGIDPLTTHAVWSAQGFDVLWSSSVPGLSLLAAPLTLALGPTASYNLVALAAPGLAGGAVHLLCRGLGARGAAAAACGLLFAICPSEAVTASSHVHLSFAAPMILAAATMAWTARAGRVTVGGIAATGAALAVQFLVSPELFAGAAGLGAAALALAALLEPARRRAVRAAALTGAAGIGLAVVATAPLFLRMATAGPGPMYRPEDFSTDVLNLVVPSALTAVRPPGGAAIAEHFGPPVWEQQGYLGAAVLALLAGLALHRASRARLRVGLAFVAVAVVASLGPRAHVAGTPGGPLPMEAVAHVPLLANLLPSRLAVFAWIGVCVVCAGWLSQGGSRLRWAAFAAVVVSVLPAVGRPEEWYRPLPAARFFASGDYRAVLGHGDRVLILPLSTSDALRWQAEDAFDFDLALGMSPGPRGIDMQDRLAVFDAPGPALPRLVAQSRANVIVLASGAPAPPRPLLRRLGFRERRIDDVVVLSARRGRPCRSPCARRSA